MPVRFFNDNDKLMLIQNRENPALSRSFRIAAAAVSFLYMIFSPVPRLYPETRIVSLEKCVDIAMQNHPELMAAYEERKIAIAEYRFAQAMTKPQVNLEIKTVEYMREGTSTNNAITIPGKDTVIGLFAGPTIIYNLIDPKKSDIEDSKRLAIDLQKMKIIQTREDIIRNIKKGYYGYSSAQETRKLMGELVDKFKSKLDMAKILFKTGQRPILDVTKAEVDYANSRLQYEKSNNTENLLKTQLLADMGIIDEEVEFAPMEIKTLPGLKFDLAALTRLAEEYFPEIKISRMRKELGKLNISTAKSEGAPRVDFLASIGFENTNTHGWKSREDIESKLNRDNWSIASHIGIKAMMPVDFLSGGGIQAKVDAAVAEYSMLNYNEKKVLVKMRALLRTYYQSMNEIKKQIEISVPIIDNAARHLMLAQKSYESGSSTQLEIHDAEMAVLEAKLNLLKARFDYMIALGNLANVIGLSEEYLCVKE